MELRASQYELIYTSLPPYEVLSTKWLSYADLCRLKQIEEVLELYYNSGQFVHTMDFLCNYFDTPYSMYDSLATWYEQHDLFGIQSSRIRKYEILLDFGAAHLQQMSRLNQLQNYAGAQCSFQYKRPLISILKEYITYDLYLREHMKNRPEFVLSMEKWKNTIHDILHRESETHELFPELSDCNYRELTKTLHVEIFEWIFDTPSVLIFCYEKRNPLTNNCINAIIPMKDL